MQNFGPVQTSPGRQKVTVEGATLQKNTCSLADTAPIEGETLQEKCTFNKHCKFKCKTSTKIQWKSRESQSEALTTSSYTTSMWENLVGASLWMSEGFQWIWVDFLHLDLYLYLSIIYKACPENNY